MALFCLSNLFSVLEYEPLFRDLCELIFFIHDQKVIEEMCTPIRNSVNRTQECFLSEPKSLMNCLSSLKSTNKKDKHKNSFGKSRSRSTPHFATLIEKEEKLVAINKKEEEKEGEAPSNRSLNIENQTVENQTDKTGHSSESEDEIFNTIDGAMSLQVEPTIDFPAPQVDVLAKNITDDEKYRQITTGTNVKYG